MFLLVWGSELQNSLWNGLHEDLKAYALYLLILFGPHASIWILSCLTHFPTQIPLLPSFLMTSANNEKWFRHKTILLPRFLTPVAPNEMNAEGSWLLLMICYTTGRNKVLRFITAVFWRNKRVEWTVGQLNFFTILLPFPAIFLVYFLIFSLQYLCIIHPWRYSGQAAPCICASNSCFWVG
jgi:hypothetical protein